MPRFAAAKADSTTDKKFSDAYNYLIDLLDQGYTTESIIDSEKIKISINPQEGLAFFQDVSGAWVKRGGMQIVDSKLTLVVDTIADPLDSSNFIRFENSDLYTHSELAFYTENLSVPELISKTFGITVNNIALDGQTQLIGYGGTSGAIVLGTNVGGVSSGLTVAYDDVTGSGYWHMLSWVGGVAAEFELEAGVGTPVLKYSFNDVPIFSVTDELFAMSCGLDVTGNIEADTYNGFSLNPEMTSFTPAIVGTTVEGTWTYTVQTGFYYCIGKICYVAIRLVIDSISGSPTGSMRIKDFPFAAATGATGQFIPALLQGVLWPTGTSQAQLGFSSGYNYGNLVFSRSDGNYLTGQISGVSVGDDIRICGCYLID